MRPAAKPLAVTFAAFAAGALLGACSPRRIPPLTTSELLEDRVMLDGVLMKCDAHPAESRDDVECQNARAAIAQLVKDPDPAVVAKRTAEFERARAERRRELDRIRAEQEAKAKVDPYTMPVVPPEGAASTAASAATTSTTAAPATPAAAPSPDGGTHPPDGGAAATPAAEPASAPKPVPPT